MLLTIEAELTEASWDWLESLGTHDCDMAINALNEGCHVFLSNNGFITASPLLSFARFMAENWKEPFIMIGVDCGFVYTRDAILARD
jgi:hypothetical protein